MLFVEKEDKSHAVQENKYIYKNTSKRKKKKKIIEDVNVKSFMFINFYIAYAQIQIQIYITYVHILSRISSYMNNSI